MGNKNKQKSRAVGGGDSSQVGRFFGGVGLSSRVLQGSSEVGSPGSSTGFRSQTAFEREELGGGQRPADDAYEASARITHGFWLQQCSWLHEENSSPASSSRKALEEAREQSAARDEQRASSRGGSRLFARILRSLTGGLSSENLARQSAGRERTPGLSSPASAQQTPVHADRKRGRAWFKKSPMSISTSVLPNAPASGSELLRSPPPASHEIRSSGGRSQSSCDQQHRPHSRATPAAGSGLGESPNRKCQSSPYRQIAKLLLVMNTRRRTSAELAGQDLHRQTGSAAVKPKQADKKSSDRMSSCLNSSPGESSSSKRGRLMPKLAKQPGSALNPRRPSQSSVPVLLLAVGGENGANRGEERADERQNHQTVRPERAAKIKTTSSGAGFFNGIFVSPLFKNKNRATSLICQQQDDNSKRPPDEQRWKFNAPKLVREKSSELKSSRGNRRGRRRSGDREKLTRGGDREIQFEGAPREPEEPLAGPNVNTCGPEAGAPLEGSGGDRSPAEPKEAQSYLGQRNEFKIQSKRSNELYYANQPLEAGKLAWTDELAEELTLMTFLPSDDSEKNCHPARETRGELLSSDKLESWLPEGAQLEASANSERMNNTRSGAAGSTCQVGLQMSSTGGAGSGRVDSPADAKEVELQLAPEAVTKGPNLLPIIRSAASSSSSESPSSSHSSTSLRSLTNDDEQDYDDQQDEEVEDEEPEVDENNKRRGSSGSSSSSARHSLVRSSKRSKVCISIEPTEIAGEEEHSRHNERPASQPAGSSVNVIQTAETAAGQQNSQTAGDNNNGNISKHFKKLVRRQQSVDSYRTARLKNKLKREQDDRGQSGKASGPEAGSKGAAGKPAKRQAEARNRKYSMRPAEASDVITVVCLGAVGASGEQPAAEEAKREFEIPKTKVEPPAAPTPPNTLSLPASSQQGTSGPGSFIVGNFSGCITPTYPTHHLPSPKYVSPSMVAPAKKYSNASTISNEQSTSIAFQSIATTATGSSVTNQQQQQLASQASDTDSLTGTIAGAGLASPSSTRLAEQKPAGQADMAKMSKLVTSVVASRRLSEEEEAAAAAARRANLAEHIYDNKCGLGEDMKFLASLPELCDITFLVGETREPVCAVKSVLAARSRVFHKILFGNRHHHQAAAKGHRQSQQQQLLLQADELEPAGKASLQGESASRRGSSPKQRRSILVNKSSSPAMSTSGRKSVSSGGGAAASAKQVWSVTSDASGYNPPTSPTNDKTEAELGPSKLSGRVSVASAGQDSLGQLSQGSQQPLIIGPGQMAAPAPPEKNKPLARAKKRSIREKSHHGGIRLTRMFTKRASDPSIKHQQQQQQQQQALLANKENQNYLDKMSSSQMSTTMIIEEFEPDVFRQLIEYIHTGCVLLQARTLLGLLNAADYYGLEQLRKACLRFVSCCITVDTVCSLLSTAERYIQYKCTKSIVQKVLEFVDLHADEIFKLNAFGLLPEHVVRLILARDGLQADEQAKYIGVYTWCEHYCRSNELTNISDVLRNFLDLIQFHKIPTNILLSEIYPTHIVPDEIFLSALAYQADPENFKPAGSERARRMTLPNPTIHSAEYSTVGAQLQPEMTDYPAGEGFRAGSAGRQPQQAPAGGRKVSSGARRPEEPAGSSKSSPGAPKLSQNRRKGSFAQASISGMMRLSHKLSIKKRHTHSAMNASQSVALGSGGQQPEVGKESAGSRARKSSVVSSASSKQKLLRQQSNANEAIQKGAEILKAFLAEQRQRELEEEVRKRRERELEEEKRRAELLASGADPQQINAILQKQAAAAANPSGNSQTGSASPQSGAHLRQSSFNQQEVPLCGGNLSQPLPGGNQQQHQQQQRQPITKSMSSRKSFKDFVQSSRKIFSRHSSTKTLQQQSSTLSSSSAASATTAASLRQQQHEGRRLGAGRSMLKIRRSETVYEGGPTGAGRQLSAAKAAQAAATTQATLTQLPQTHNSRLSHQLSSNMPTK